MPRTNKTTKKNKNTKTKKEKIVEEPRIAERKVEEQVSSHVERKTCEGIPAVIEPLPASYEEDKLVLLVRDPRWIFAYWDLSNQSKIKLAVEIEKSLGTLRKTLRVYELTKGKKKCVDIDVGNTTSWYINVPHPDTEYQAEFGLKDENDNFVPILISNVVRVPREAPTHLTDEKWMVVNEIFELILRAKSGEFFGSSGEVIRRIEQIVKEEVKVPNITSPGVGSWGSMPRGMEERRGFWFIADTELIVYGATEKDASVTANGFPVALREDGTFTLRYALPDGEREILLKARSKDGKEEREIKIEVTRRMRA
ncbi:MAG: DUF4912 domain-containing protein [Thermoplasmata archaeon]